MSNINFIDNVIKHNKKEYGIIKVLDCISKIGKINKLHNIKIDKFLSIEDTKIFIQKYFNVNLVIYKKGFYFIY